MLTYQLLYLSFPLWSSLANAQRIRGLNQNWRCLRIELKTESGSCLRSGILKSFRSGMSSVLLKIHARANRTCYCWRSHFSSEVSIKYSAGLITNPKIDTRRKTTINVWNWSSVSLNNLLMIAFVAWTSRESCLVRRPHYSTRTRVTKS